MPDPSSHRLLFEIAASQHGHFTAAQAAACGISWDSLSHGTCSGRYLRVRRGLYRLRDYPSTPYEEIAAACLAAGKDIAVVSHASALALHDLGDIIPDRVHLTLPRSRRNVTPIPGVALHTTTLPLLSSEITEREGIRVTTPARSLLDAAEIGSDPDHIARAIRQAIARGWISPLLLTDAAAARSHRVQQVIQAGLAS